MFIPYVFIFDILFFKDFIGAFDFHYRLLNVVNVPHSINKISWFLAEQDKPNGAGRSWRQGGKIISALIIIVNKQADLEAKMYRAGSGQTQGTWEAYQMTDQQ